MSSHLDLVPLPNLPGYKPNKQKSGSKVKSFDLVNGEIFLVENTLPKIEQSLEDSRSILNIGAGNTAGGKMAAEENVNITLTFQAYFEEMVDMGDGEEMRIRKCNIYFFMENGTITVVEKPQMNSGLAQGTLVRKGIVHDANGKALTPDDFRLGAEVTMYGRAYKIVDCDAATRKYMRRNYGHDAEEGGSVPIDDYAEFRKTIQPDLSDIKWGRFNCKKNDGTKYQQAKMGCNPDANNGREGFIRYGDKTINFLLVWDNTGTMYGDRVKFRMKYYLCDDTVEIFSIPNPTSGQKDTFSRLLKRSKLPLFFGGLRDLQAPRDQERFFHWTDFYIGLELDVYARTLRCVDADNATRQFYVDNGIPLEGIEPDPTPKVVVQEREIPPPTAFGSEEDSLRSCFGSLMPGPPPAKKYGENKNLNFFASLLSGGEDDVDRRFVITYYVTDNTLKVQEPPVRNSGFVGGVFLSRRAVKTPAGDTMMPIDMFIGCHLQVLKHRFLLLDANDATLRWMEDQMYPRSMFYIILDKVRPFMMDDLESGELERKFAACENGPEEAGLATKDSFRAVLSSYDIFDRDGTMPNLVTEHELTTLMRAGGNKTPYFSVKKLMEQLVAPTDEFK
jgi:hypothetical protein